MNKLYTALIGSLLNEDHTKASAIFKNILNEKSTNLLCENVNNKIAYVSNVDFMNDNVEVTSEYKTDISVEYTVPIEVVVANGHYELESPDEYENDPEHIFVESGVKIKFKATIEIKADAHDQRDPWYGVTGLALENDTYGFTSGDDKNSIISKEAYNAILDDLIKQLENHYRFSGAEGLFDHVYKMAVW